MLFDDFCGCFNDADVVAIADVFAAGEDPIEGADRDSLVAGLIAGGHKHAHAIADETAFRDFVKTETKPGDLLICLGAGTISAWANGLVEGA